jgi:hypothetical protein
MTFDKFYQYNFPTTIGLVLARATLIVIDDKYSP